MECILEVSVTTLTFLAVGIDVIVIMSALSSVTNDDSIALSAGRRVGASFGVNDVYDAS